MALLVLVIALVALALLALRSGDDSRDGFATLNHELDAIALRRDFASDDPLAREALAVRSRRVADHRVVSGSFEDNRAALEPAA
ncbi:MAG: hypothetical protein U0031_19620 [Thermomicrobiales bacterium]